MVPVAPKVDGIIGDHHHMEGPRWDGQFTSRTEIFLLCLVWLYGVDGYVEKRAHAITAAVATTTRTTMATSNADFSFSRNGLKPTLKR